MLALLKPWQFVFDPQNWEPLMEKVAVKFERTIAGIAIEPDGQDVDNILNLFAWVDVLSPSRIAQVLSTALFPQWQAALQTWLQTPDCEFSEVLEWYQAWRDLLPEVVREQGLVQVQLKRGLEMVKGHMQKGVSMPSPSEEPLPHGPTPSLSSFIPNVRVAISAPRADEIGLSMSDYMTELASEQGLVFCPKPGKSHLGKQIYQLGGTSVFMDRGLVFTPTSDSSGWQPTQLDEVLRLARITKKTTRKNTTN